jgi:FlaA1/EpsC-like NDP-sugar epimerase
MEETNPISKLLNWYFRRKSLPYWCILTLDVLIVFFSGVLVFYAYHRGYQTLISSSGLIHLLLVYLAVSVISFRCFRTYSGIIRFSSFVDLQRVAYANMLSMLAALVLRYTVFTEPTTSFAFFDSWQILLLFMLSTALMWAVRVLVKALYDVTASDKKALKALIYGTKDGGVSIAKSIRSQKPAHYILKGFVSHDQSYDHHLLMGVKVYETTEAVREAIVKDGIQALLVSPLRTERFRNNQELQNVLIEAGVKIFFVENAKEWDGKGQQPASDMQMKEVQVEDLLPREAINIDLKGIGQELKEKCILITGAAGSIGSEMVRQIAKFKPKKMVLIDQAETPLHDIRLMMEKEWPDVKAETIVTTICNQERMEKVFSVFRPNYVFHAAAYKHVPMMEDNPCEAVQNNVVGTKVIADLSVKYGVKKFVMVSTDKAVNPTNVMGCSKRICEIYVQAMDKWLRKGNSVTQFVTTRFGNVLGSSGSVIPLFREQIKNGGPVTVTHPDIIRYFMLIPEACQLVLEAGVKGNGGEILVFDMGQPVPIAELAKKMILLSGVKDVKVEFTGLRPGEKLYEEVLSNEENSKPSFHEKIRIAEVRQYDFEEVSREIDKLVETSYTFDKTATVREMKNIVPEYKSQNSIYEALDV